jgi:hypothetical protein
MSSEYRWRRGDTVQHMLSVIPAIYVPAYPGAAALGSATGSAPSR